MSASSQATGVHLRALHGRPVEVDLAGLLEAVPDAATRYREWCEVSPPRWTFAFRYSDRFAAAAYALANAEQGNRWAGPYTMPDGSVVGIVARGA